VSEHPKSKQAEEKRRAVGRVEEVMQRVSVSRTAKYIDID
jgi:hypothetical protein